MDFVSKIHNKDPMVSSALFAMALHKKCYLYLFQNHAFPQEILGPKICAARKF